MKKALFAALASVAVLGASCSCSVKDFAPVVLDSASYVCSYTNATFLDASTAEISTFEELGDLYGKYSFRYGFLSRNLVDPTLFVIGYEMNGATGQIIENSYSYKTTAAYTPCRSGATYSKSATAGQYGDGFNVYCYDSSKNFISRVATYTTSSFVTPSNGAFLRFEAVAGASGFMLNEGSTLLAYEPFALGMSYDTPISGIGSAAFAVASNGYPVDRQVYSDNPSYPELANFSINLMSLGFDLSDEVLGVFHNAAIDALSRATTRNVGELGYDDTGSPYKLTWVVDNPYDAYIEFEISSPLPERFKDTIVDGLEYIQFELKDASDTKSGYLYPGGALFSAMDDYLISGLLDVQGFKSYLVSEYGTDLTGDVSMQLHFYYGLNGKDLNFSPIYVDNRSYGAVNDLDLMPFVSAGAVINLGNQWDCFVLNMNSTFAGLATSYNGEFATIGDEIYYRDLRIFTPRNQSANKLRYVGVLSSYARGYADGVASRDGEVADLTEQILGLQEDLSQYEGKTYQQIYNLGYQAGLDEENQGARTFNSLFGNILTAPLTILNGISDISFFGMPILTAILSLLMVALALFLFKRFK